MTTSDFIKQIEAGAVPPLEIEQVLRAMHSAMCDHFKPAYRFMPFDFREVADRFHHAIECDEAGGAEA